MNTYTMYPKGADIRYNIEKRLVYILDDVWFIKREAPKGAFLTDDFLLKYGVKMSGKVMRLFND